MVVGPLSILSERFREVLVPIKEPEAFEEIEDTDAKLMGMLEEEKERLASWLFSKMSLELEKPWLFDGFQVIAHCTSAISYASA